MNFIIIINLNLTTTTNLNFIINNLSLSLIFEWIKEFILIICLTRFIKIKNLSQSKVVNLRTK